MRRNTTIKTVPALLAALMLSGVATYAATALNGQVTLRPLTPQEKKDYSLTTAQGASGLSAVGLGQPAYLEALVNLAIAPSNITSVTWVLTNKPAGSSATLVDSPLGTSVPTYKMADRASLQVASRKMLVPDVAGQYVVAVTIVAAGTGPTSTNLTQRISGATYVGLQTCALCHSGGIVAEDIYETWVETPHASFFTRAIDGLENDHYGKNCISCHTVGYDTATNAVNGGFDDVATQLGWSFPTNLVSGNWAAMPAELKNLANIQCENCHGPGSEHAMALGNTNVSNWPRLGVSFSVGDCAQCHDSKPNHVKNAEWNNSRHAVATRSPSGPSRPQCVLCHTAPGFAGYLENKGSTTPYVTNTVYEAIACAACHDPHDDSNPSQLRTPSMVTLDCGTVVTNAGKGALCMNCHQSRTGNVTNSIVKYPLLQPTWNGGSSFGPHDNPAADMLMGVNGWTYGQDIPSSAHRFVVSDACVTCHMQEVPTTDPGFTKVGGHTFNMAYTVITNGLTNLVERTEACVRCHGPMESFDLVKADYNGDGITEGVQAEVTKLISRLSTLMPNSTYRADGNYVADGLVKSSLSVKTNWQSNFLKGAWNWQFVNYDLSKGVHNAPYAVGLLKASIADLTGDSNEDGLPDSWQIQYFGSATNPSAAPNATPAGDGVPNWLKYSLGLNPTVPGMSLPDGVVWINATNSATGGTNTLRIYTAAEVTFNTQTGKSYQIQSTASVSGGWVNVGTPITGTGGAVSYVTPTRSNAQQFYRVVVTP